MPCPSMSLADSMGSTQPGGPVRGPVTREGCLTSCTAAGRDFQLAYDALRARARSAERADEKRVAPPASLETLAPVTTSATGLVGSARCCLVDCRHQRFDVRHGGRDDLHQNGVHGGFGQQRRDACAEALGVAAAPRSTGLLSPQRLRTR